MYDNNNSNSTEPLKQFLLQIPKKKKNNDDITEKSKNYDDSVPSPFFYLSIKNPCKDIIHIGANAEEYYHAELVYDDNNEIEYAIQAYGEQAKELYKEINTFNTTCSRLFHEETKQEEHENLMLVKKAIDCIVDYDLTNGCVLVFRKFKNVCVSKRKIMYE